MKPLPSISYWDWLIAPANAGSVGAWGLILGLVGFALTILGLYLALVQLRKLETATNAATSAVENFKLRLVQYDAATDTTTARYAIQSARRHLDNDAWRDFVETYEDARLAMLRVLPTLQAPEDEPNTFAISLMIDRIGKTCELVHAYLIKVDRKPPDKVRTLKQLRDQIDLVNSIHKTISERAI